MPPCSSHHLIIALTASPISLLRPGSPVKPRWSPYAMWIDVSVTPWSVAPFALPGPQGDGSVPNVCPVAAAAVEVVAPATDVGDVDGEPDRRLLLQAASVMAMSATTARTAPRAARCMFTPWGRLACGTSHGSTRRATSRRISYIVNELRMGG